MTEQSHEHELKNLRMNGDWMFVNPILEPKEINGIIIPDTDSSQEVTQKGEVVASRLKSPDDLLLVGTRILFRRNASFKKIEINGKTFLVMKKHSVLGVLYGDKAHEVTSLGSYVFLRWEFSHSEYERSGLIRPDAYRQMHYTGYVISHGSDTKEVHINDRVFFDQFCGVEKFEENGIRYAFVREDDIYCTNIPSREEVLSA